MKYKNIIPAYLFSHNGEATYYEDLIVKVYENGGEILVDNVDLNDNEYIKHCLNLE